MKSPWLDIPLTDYEAHMALPHVGQAQLLSDIFASVLDEYAPASVAVLGCAGGNGFDRISPHTTGRVVGVDLNPEYIEEARLRFSRRFPVLELFVGDLERDEIACSPVDLVFAPLVLEYVDVDTVLPRTCSMLRPRGTLVTVVQLPSDTVPEVTPSQFAILSTLSSVMRLVSPDRLRRLARAHGYRQIDCQLSEAPGGKRFQIQTFQSLMPDDRLQPPPESGPSQSAP